MNYQKEIDSFKREVVKLISLLEQSLQALEERGHVYENLWTINDNL
jgi:hypothetical protein